MKKLITCILIGMTSVQSFSQSILMFVSHEQTYYSEYIVMKEALEASGYTVDVRSASTMDFSIYMSPYDDITDVANDLSGSNYAQFQTQFSELFGATWDEASHDAIPSFESVTGSILDVTNIDNYDGLIVVGGTGALDYRVDGSYSSQGVGGREILAADIQAAAEKLNALALEALQEGKPVMAQCHGASIPAFWRIPNTSGVGEEALGNSFLKGGVATGYPETETGPTLTSLDITHRVNDRVTISDPHTSLEDNNAGIGKIITTRDWYPQTVAYAARTFLNVLETYPKTYSRTSQVNVLVLHGGAVDESDMPNSCSGGNKNNDVPCNNGTSVSDLPADYTHLMELLAGSGSSDDFNINGSELDLSGSLPFDINSESEILDELGNYDVVIFFKHWSTFISDELQNALVTYADNGGGVMALHHGLYNDVDNGQNKDILANELFGAHSTQSGWSATLTNYDVQSTNYGHFISSYLIDYDAAQTDPSAWTTNPLPTSASSPYSYLQSFEVYDELYNNMSFTGTIDLGREVNEITPLFSNDRSTNSITHTTAFTREVDIDDNEAIGRVVYFEIGERKENVTSSSRFGQIVRNAVVWSANKANSIISWNGASWSNGSGPATSDDIVLTGNYNTSSGDLTIANLSIDFNSNITIGDGEFIQVDGDLVHNGSDLTVQSGGSLLTKGSVSGSNFTIERTTTFDENTGRYSSVGSPIANASFDVLGNNALIYGYDETEPFNISGDQGESRFKTPQQLGITEMETGKGYFSANTGDQNGAIIFTGTPNTGTQQVQLTYTDHPAEEDVFEGFNLVANPYPSALNFTSFITHNTADIEGAIYIWDDYDSENARGMESDYIIINEIGNVDSRQMGLTDWDNHIRSMQGFFVQAKSTGDLQLEFTNDMRVITNNSDQAFYRAEGVSSFKLSLIGLDVYAETLIGMKENATIDHDQYDARFIGESSTGIYTLISGGKYAIQSIPFSNDISIDLGMNNLENTDYQISLNEEKNMEGYAVFLVDNELNKTVNLSMEYAYNFTSSVNNSNRFSVQITNSTTGTENLATDWIIFKNQQGQIQLNTTSNTIPSRIDLVSLSGKQIPLVFTQIDDNKWVVDQPANTGLFVLKIYSDVEVFSKKIILR
jgi:putative intracellular protease/amidase/type 1 glutamine amidotransferase